MIFPFCTALTFHHKLLYKVFQFLFLYKQFIILMTWQLLHWTVSSFQCAFWKPLFYLFLIVCRLVTSSRKSKRVPEKTSISALLTMPKPSTVWITIKHGKFWKSSEDQATWPASWETCMQVRKQQLELDIEQQTGSK